MQAAARPLKPEATVLTVLVFLRIDDAKNEENTVSDLV